MTGQEACGTKQEVAMYVSFTVVDASGQTVNKLEVARHWGLEGTIRAAEYTADPAKQYRLPLHLAIAL